MSADDVAYLDANGTTLMPQPVIDAMNRWLNRGNPSALYASAKDAQKMMAAFRRAIAAECGFDLDGDDPYAVVFTSGGSESNCYIATAAARSYAAKTKRMPHIIISAVEHKSLLECCKRLVKDGMAIVTVLPVTQPGTGKPVGRVEISALQAALRPNTCLVSIMAANNETGVLNDLKAIGAVCRQAGVPFHTDAVQVFGKVPFRPVANNVSAFSASFHKMHGPPGVGLLVMRRNLIDGYDLCPLICGSQNDGLRGGTENVPGIAASFAAFKHSMADLPDKVQRMRTVRDAVKKAISKSLPCFYLDEHPGDPVTGPPPAAALLAGPGPQSRIHAAAAASAAAAAAAGRPGHPGSPEAARAIAQSERGGPPVVFWLSPSDMTHVLPNTILLAVRRPRVCNKAMRAALEARNVIVALGSACNTKEAHAGSASTVVSAMGVPKALHAGVIRVSFSDDVTTADATKFVKAFLAVVNSRDCLSASPAEDAPEAEPDATPV